MRDRGRLGAFDSNLGRRDGPSRAKVLEFIDMLDVKLVPWQQHLLLTLLCGPSPWDLLWRNVFEWLSVPPPERSGPLRPWPRFALQNFSENDYYA